MEQEVMKVVSLCIPSPYKRQEETKNMCSCIFVNLSKKERTCAALQIKYKKKKMKSKFSKYFHFIFSSNE